MAAGIVAVGAHGAAGGPSAGGEVRIADPAVAADPLAVLRVARAAAVRGAAIERASLQLLAASPPDLPEPWPPEALRLLVDLLATGPRAVPVIEALDQRGLWVALFPEWAAIRALPPHSAYHRWTVDRHLLEAVAIASALAPRLDRPDLLLIAALLHDIGKGVEGDHCEAGAAMALWIARRLGLAAEDADTVAFAVAQHLLLGETAMTRDLDDPETIGRVAEIVGSRERLDLLAAVTEADSLATGTSAWGPWKAELMGELVDRVAAHLEGFPGDAVSAFPTPAQLERLAVGGEHIEARGHVLTVMTDDRPGLFSRVAGVLAFHGLDVLAAAAYSSDQGRALNEFRVADGPAGEPRWAAVVSDLRRALDGSLAIGARVVDRARTYAGRGALSRNRVLPSVRFDNNASLEATVIDVLAGDAIGTLYGITRTLAEFDLDIRTAHAQTIGAEVIDAFYVRDRRGAKVTDPEHQAEIERAILHTLGELRLE